MSMPINDAGVALLEEFESFVSHAYPDPYSPLGKELQRRGKWKMYLRTPFVLTGDLAGLSGAPWTIGLGFTAGVKEGDKMTRAQALVRLAKELQQYADGVRNACTLQPNENELAAMVCLAWNIGIAGFRKSTVLKAHNRGERQAASRAFGLWNRAGGVESAGLTRRRAAEAALYLKPVAFEEAPPMPQAIEPESSLTRSPIVTSSTVTAGTATVAVAAEAARGVKDIRDSLGDWLPFVLVGACVVAAGYAIWQRVRQRSGGWA